MANFNWKPVMLGLVGLNICLLLVYNTWSFTASPWIRSMVSMHSQSSPDRTATPTTLNTEHLNVSELPQTPNVSTDVAIGCAITFRKVPLDKAIEKAPLFNNFLPTFCQTSSLGFNYHFYFAHDHDDPYFKQPNSHKMFLDSFQSVLRNKTDCLKRNIKVFVHLTESPSSGKPAWSQNDAMWAAYLDHRTFYFRVNDDTQIADAGWTEAFIDTLKNLNPPYVGVTGPNHSGGNTNILTYDFTHITHQDIFGYHYSHYFPDWYADDWITKIYRPDRSIKLRTKRLNHTLQMGQRYRNTHEPYKFLAPDVKRCAKIVNQWIARENKNKEEKLPIAPDPHYVVAMSLYGNGPKYTHGAVHNAALIRHNFPGWTLRIYTEQVTNGSSRKYPAVDAKLITKLKSQGAQIVELERSVVEKIPPMMWRFLPADDLSLEAFISRDTDSRLTERDAVHVRDWLKNGNSTSLHCIRDHPSHSNFPLSGGLWGTRPKILNKQLDGKTVKDLMLSKPFSSAYLQDMNFLNQVLWPIVQSSAYCHDAFSCTSDKFSSSSHPFLLARPEDGEHVGQVYDEWGIGRQVDIDIIKKHKKNEKCSP